MEWRERSSKACDHEPHSQYSPHNHPGKSRLPCSLAPCVPLEHSHALSRLAVSKVGTSSEVVSYAMMRVFHNGVRWVERIL